MATAPARPTANDRIRAALWFAERGFGVFSVWSTHPNGECRCPPSSSTRSKGGPCDQPGKHPITGHGFKDATTDPARIKTLLSAGSEPNYGLVPPEGVFILDVDGDGVALLATLEARYGPLPPTLRTDTAHGQHVFLRWPEALPRPIGQLWGYITRWGSGKDTGYVIGPRSIHATGAVYRPAAGAVMEIAELPEAWAQSVIHKPEADKPDDDYEIPAGGYQLPDFGYTGSRYRAVLEFVGSRYMKGIGIDEIWLGVVGILAPRFAEPVTEGELRSRFDRAWKGTPEKFGPPNALTLPTPPTRPRTAADIEASSIDAADLLELDIPPLTWIIPDLLPEGTTVLAGPPKLGKSCLVYQMAVEVSLGGELLGRSVDQGDVLYLALEDGKRRGQSRIRAALAERLMPRGRLEVRWASAKIGEGLEAEIIAWLDDHPDAKLVAIDTLQKVRARADSRRNAYEVDVEDLGRLQNLFRDRAVGLLIVHHSKKDAGDDFLASVSGTYGITGSVDTTMVIQRKRLETFGKLVVTGRDIQEVEEPVQFTGMTWTQAPRSLAEASFEQSEVYKVIADSGPIFAKAIADLIGSTREAVQRLVEKLVSKGSIVRKSGGYTVAPPPFDEEAEEVQMPETGVETSSASLAGAPARVGVPTSSTSSTSSASSPQAVPTTSAHFDEEAEEAEEVGTHVRAREADLTVVGDSDPAPVATWCHYQADHAFQHRDVQTRAPWCEICSPRGIPA